MGDDGRPPSLPHASLAPSSERSQWQRIFSALLEMLRQRQRQVETLAGDRKFLQDYAHLQHGRWGSKTRLLESQISQVRKEKEMGRRVEDAKLGLMIALKQMESSCYKELAEDADNILQDFRECVESLNCEVLLLKEKPEDRKGKQTDMGMMEPCVLETAKAGTEEENVSSGLKELRKWKQAYEKLKSKKETEVSALLAEKDFVWHQLKVMESEYTSLLKSKQVEVEQANEAFEKLQANVETLQSSAVDKDETINKLKADISRTELELQNCTREAQMSNEEIKKLHFDTEQLQASVKERDSIIAKLQSELAKHKVDSRQFSKKKSRASKESSLSKSGRSVTPAGRPQQVAVSRGSSLPNDSSRPRTTETGLRRCSKRKSVAPILMLDSPKLFPSTFKIPKLKNAASPAPV